jgi:hypothetical protein
MRNHQVRERPSTEKDRHDARVTNHESGSFCHRRYFEAYPPLAGGGYYSSTGHCVVAAAAHSSLDPERG